MREHVEAAYAATRAEIAAAGAPRSLDDTAWHSEQEAIWRRFVMRTIMRTPESLSGATYGRLVDVFTELGALNTTERLMASIATASGDRQRLRLQAASPLRAPAVQHDASDLPLFSAAEQLVLL